MCLVDITDRKGSAVHIVVCYSPIYIYIFVIVFIQIFKLTSLRIQAKLRCYGSCPVCMLAKCVVSPSGRIA
jgi:hypothetical protein